MAPERPVVLFVCVHNAGRSQMAAALLEARAGQGVEVRSAGSAPGAQLHPVVVEAMRELGIDLSARRPTGLTDAMARGADVVVTMGCGDACPVVPGSRHLDWDLDDPSGKDLAGVRAIRDEIDRRVQQLVAELA